MHTQKSDMAWLSRISSLLKLGTTHLPTNQSALCFSEGGL